jgi:hypothetical protein
MDPVLLEATVEGMASSVGRRKHSSVHLTHRLAGVRPQEPQPLASDTARILEIGIALWGVALAVSLLVPALHEGQRSWWPWACVAGIVGGGLALLYVRRGRGNAAGANLSARSPRPESDPTKGVHRKIRSRLTRQHR